MDTTAMMLTQKTLGSTVLDRIGNTSLLRIDSLTEHLPGIQILGKAEWLNPGGSVKDRAASSIVLDARRRGLLGSGRGLLDATSGNTGIAYAMLGSALGFPVTLCMPSNVSPERKRYLAAYGAEIIWTNPARAPTAPSARPASSPPNSPTATSMPTSTPTTRTGWRTTAPPLMRSGSRPKARSLTSSLPSEPAEPSWEPPAACAS